MTPVDGALGSAWPATQLAAAPDRCGQRAGPVAPTTRSTMRWIKPFRRLGASGPGARAGPEASLDAHQIVALTPEENLIATESFTSSL